MKKIYDVTLPISEQLPVWPGDPAVRISLESSIADGDPCNISRLELGVHSGTHIDAPGHFLADGSGVDAIPLERLLGPCLVVETPADKLIEREDLSAIDLTEVSRVLFKTRNSELWRNGVTKFSEDFVSLSEAAAGLLVENNVELIGVDYLSIEGFYAEGHSVHKSLLKNDVVILEGLNLAGVPQGEYELICLPLKLFSRDGAPVRVLLVGDA